MNFQSILNEAFEKAKKALLKCVPVPMKFYSADLSGKRLGPSSIEDEGDCGGAYITGLKGTSEIVKFFKKNGIKENEYTYTLPDGTHIRKGVIKGYTLHANTSPIYNGQSHNRKKAFYDTYAQVLKTNGIQCGVRDYLT